MPQVISATQARNQFADIVDRVVYAGEEFVVEKQGKPVVLISKVTSKNRVADKKTITGIEFLQRLAKYEAKGLPPDLGKNHDKYAWE